MKIVDSDSGRSQESLKSKIFFGWIHLQPKISKVNYLCSLFHYFAQTFIFVSVESLQPMLFQRKFGISPSNQGEENGYILLIDILTKCLFAPISGIASDKYGRKYVLLTGIIITGISLVLMGYTSNLYPEYCLARVVYAIGAITMATMPLLADYVEDQTKGRGSAINVVLAALGAVFSATVITNLLIQNLEIEKAYLTVGVIIIIIGTLYTQGLKPGVYFKDKINNSLLENEETEEDIINKEEIRVLQENSEPNIKTALKIGILAGKNIWIFQGYLTNFLGRGDSILLTLSLVIWSQNYVDPNLNPDDAYKTANIQAQTLSGAAYTVIMIFALVFGLLMERVSKNKVLISIFFLTLIGCVLMNFAPGPSSPLTFVFMSILGIGMSGLYTSALYLINKYAYAQYRGYITGLANVFSVLGIMTCAFIGGILQSRWNKVAPFNLFGIMSLIGLIITIVSACNKKQRKD